MNTEFHTQQKLNAITAQIEQLLLADFPHPASEDALRCFAVFFQKQKERLQKAAVGKSPGTLSSTCTTVNERILQFLPLLGFLLRSTNVRNNFEAYDAFVQLAEALIGPHARVRTHKNVGMISGL